MEDNEEEVKQQKRNLHSAKKRQDKSDKELEQIIDKGIRLPLSGRPDLVKLPDHLVVTSIDEFYTAQDSLQQRYPENDSIIELMNKYDNWKKDIEANPWKKGIEETYKNFPPPPEIPSELMQEFGTVCRIRREVSVGKDEGISYQLGEKSEKIIKKKFESDRQSKVASGERPDALQNLIIEILKKEPKAKEFDVLRELKKLEHDENDKVIYAISETQIEWVKDDGTLADPPAPISGLKHRISRAKKKIKNS